MCVEFMGVYIHICKCSILSVIFFFLELESKKIVEYCKVFAFWSALFYPNTIKRILVQTLFHQHYLLDFYGTFYHFGETLGNYTTTNFSVCWRDLKANNVESLRRFMSLTLTYFTVLLRVITNKKWFKSI